MIDPQENSLFNVPEYESIKDENFAAFPPPLSPGQGDVEGELFANGDEEGDLSKLPDAPVAKRRTVKRPQPKLDSVRLTSERGLPALRTLFDDVRFRGKGHEAEDLRVLMQKMENWAHRLYPKMQFEEFIDKVEFLGSKKEVQTCLKRIRLDMPLTHEDFNTKEDEREDCLQDEHVSEELDPFADGGFRDDHIIHSTPASLSLTEEQRHRIELNKQQALERRLARQQQQQGASQPVDREEPSDHSPTVSSQENDLHVPGTEETEKPQQPVRATRPASPLFDDECYSPAAELANGTADSSD